MSSLRATALVQAKAAYLAVMRRVGGTRGVAPPRGQRWRHWRHWRHSLALVHDSAALAALDVPWWTYRAIDAVEAWLATRPHPVRVFEYGSGASSVWLARRVDELYGVEHDRDFAESFAPTLAGLDNAHLRIVEPVRVERPRTPSAKEGYAGLDFSDYVAAIDDVGGEFDLVVVDGRAREACLARALPRLRPDGIVVFDNSRRRRYRAAIAASGLREQRFRGLTPTLPYPEQTSLLSATPWSVPTRPR